MSRDIIVVANMSRAPKLLNSYGHELVYDQLAVALGEPRADADHYNYSWWGFKVTWSCTCHPADIVPVLIDPSSSRAARGFLTRQHAFEAVLDWIHSTMNPTDKLHPGWIKMTAHLWNPQERSYDVNPIVLGTNPAK